MTKVYLLLPLLATNISTNNSEIITKIVRQYYPGCKVDAVHWIQGSHSEEEQFECAVSIDGIQLNLDYVAECIAKVKSQEDSIVKLKNDVFNVIDRYETVLAEKNSLTAKLEKQKEEGKDSFEDASVSLKF